MACDKVSTLSSDTYAFKGGRNAPYGWYLSRSIPFHKQVKINQEIMNIVVSGRLSSIFKRTVGDLGSCGSQKLSISPEIITIPLVTGIIIILIFGTTSKSVEKDELRNERHETRNLQLSAGFPFLGNEAQEHR